MNSIIWTQANLLSLHQYQVYLNRAAELGLPILHPLLEEWDKGDQGDENLIHFYGGLLLGAEGFLVRSILNAEFDAITAAGHPIAAIRRLQEILTFSQKLGINGPSLANLFQLDTYSEAKTARNIIKSAIRAKFKSEEDWEEAFEDYQDRLNMIRRDALCDYLTGLGQGSGFSQC